jgi:hypothetical protein
MVFPPSHCMKKKLTTPITKNALCPNQKLLHEVTPSHPGVKKIYVSVVWIINNLLMQILMKNTMTTNGEQGKSTKTNIAVCVCVCVCVFLSSSRGGLPSDAVLTTRQIHPPPMPATSFSRQSPHQPPPGEMLADWCPLGYAYGTATTNFVGTILWSPSDAPPGVSLCDT